MPRRAREPRDTLGRPLRDLRISVMDRCNFRCPYCMPKETFHDGYRFLKSAERLSFEEIVRLARLAVPLGVRKLRLTGGEPLLRPNLADLVGDLACIEGVDDLALTTNGVLLAQHAAPLAANGLKRVTVSLDSLDRDVFRHMSGGFDGLDEVLDGIEHARRAGLAPIKINAVVQRGINDHTVLDMIEHFRGSGVIVRFIEYMDVGNRNHWEPGLVVPSAELAARIGARWPLHPTGTRRTTAARSPSAIASTTAAARSASSRRSRSRSAATARARGCLRRARCTPACSPTKAPTCAARCAPARATPSCPSCCRRSGRAAPTATASCAPNCARAAAAQDRDVLHRRLRPWHAARAQNRRNGSGLTHLDAARTSPTMVDVGDKAVTQRKAIAEARVVLPGHVAATLESQGFSTRKGPVFQTAIIAGTMAAKRTHELIPFCHPLPLDGCRSTSTVVAAGW